MPTVDCPHPGTVLRFKLEELKMSQRKLAVQMKRPYQAINEIIRGGKSITADTALQLEEALNISAIYWLNLQTDYDLMIARNLRSKEGCDV